MQIHLQTYSSFLRQHFAQSRFLLVGGEGYKVLGTGYKAQVAWTPVVSASTKPIKPSFNFPKVSLPVISVPKIAFPQVTLPQIKISLPNLPSFNSTWGVKAAQLFLSLIMVTSITIVAVLFVPEVYYKAFPADVKPVEKIEEGSPIGGSFDRTQEATSSSVKAITKVTPPKDENLPEGTWVVIPRIGVRTQLDPSLTADQALEKGVWMAPEYGTPGDLTQPVILAAHRYGWQWWWKSDYWKYHSFYLLPDLQPGDIVEVIADQRKYYYEIYDGEEGEEISDYTADMILYTCKYLSSPIRHFRYARLVDMGKNSQG